MGITPWGMRAGSTARLKSSAGASLAGSLILILTPACGSHSGDSSSIPSPKVSAPSPPYTPKNNDLCQTIYSRISTLISASQVTPMLAARNVTRCSYTSEPEIVRTQYDPERDAGQADHKLNAEPSGDGPNVGDRSRWFAKVPGPICELRARKNNAIFSVKLIRFTQYYTADECGKRAPAILQQTIAAVPPG